MTSRQRGTARRAASTTYRSTPPVPPLETAGALLPYQPATVRFPCTRATNVRRAYRARGWHRSWRAAGIRSQLGRPGLKKNCDDFRGPVSNLVTATRDIAVTGPDIPISPRPPPAKEPAR